MKTQRLIEKVGEYLITEYVNDLNAEITKFSHYVIGARNTDKIKDYINSNLRHGTSSQQLGNVLSKNKVYVKCGTEPVRAIMGGHYDIAQWKIDLHKFSDKYPDHFEYILNKHKIDRNILFDNDISLEALL